MSSIQFTPGKGWPYFDDETGYVADFPAFTRDLARKLDTTDAAAPAAINAATQAQAAADRLTQLYGTVAQRSTYIPRKPVFVFIDDDGWKATFTTLKPIFDTRNLRCTLAIPPGQLKDNTDPAAHPLDIMTIAQVKQMYQEGYDIQSHTWTHYDFTNDPAGTQQITLPMQDDTTMHFQLTKALEWFEENGIDGVKHLIYPKGDRDQRVMDAVAIYYESGITTTWGVTYPPIPSYEVKRIGISTGVSLEQNYAAIDETFANGGICIFMTHITQLTPPENLTAVLDYIIGKGGEIITYAEMWKRMRNPLEAGQQIYDTYSVPFAVGFDGSIALTGLNGIKPSYESIPINEPLTTYQTNTETIVNYRSSYIQANPGLVPVTVGGTLHTLRYGAEDTSFSHQEFKPYNSAQIFIRRWVDNAWSTWYLQTQGVMGTNAYTLDTPLSGFPPNTLTRTFITGDGASNTRPGNLNGTLETTRYTDDGLNSYQKYISTNGGDIFRRKWNIESNSWNDWTQESSTYNCRITYGTFANRPTTPNMRHLYLATDRPVGDPDRLTINFGTGWLQV